MKKRERREENVRCLCRATRVVALLKERNVFVEMPFVVSPAHEKLIRKK
jgi:hypothetical protein